MLRRLYLSFLICLPYALFAFPDKEIRHYELVWKAPDSMQIGSFDIVKRLAFESAVYPSSKPLIPHVQFSENVAGNNEIYSFKILNINSIELTADESLLVISADLDADYTVSNRILSSRGNHIMYTEIAGIRLNPENRKMEKLLSFDLEITFEGTKSLKSGNLSPITSSVLSQGDWYRIRFNKNGVYKITGAEMKSMGIELSGLNPQTIQLYGNGGGMLPTDNIDSRPDDLQEIAIQLVDGDDGNFDASDYIQFYGQGPTTWKYNSLTGLYSHQIHYYDDFSYVFLTHSQGTGKRIESQYTAGTKLGTITEFPDYQVINEDLYNLTNTGRTWFGDLFDVSLTRNYNFEFPDMLTNHNGTIYVNLGGRTFNGASFQVNVDNQETKNVSIPSTSATSYTFARTASTKFEFAPTGNTVSAALTFSRLSNTSRGWLDFIEINVWRSLRMSGDMMQFRNPISSHQVGVYEYELSNAGTNTKIWEVTDPLNPKLISVNSEPLKLIFSLSADTSREMIAFNEPGVLSTEFVEKLENQNLHSLKDIDYLIISPDEFLSQAERLAEMHRNNGLIVYVTTPRKIYNEFSSGAQDVSAIRDFARKLYTGSTAGRELRYMLMFGDGSFDYKDIIGGNSNYVPTWETIESLDLVGSIATDDYFGFLDETEGEAEYSLVDIGIGRFPVSSLEQATEMVDKVEHYLLKEDRIMGPWRNSLTFVADDGDSNLHLKDAETLVTYLSAEQRSLNIDKVYLDSFKQIATTGGQKAPDMNEAINNRIEKGSLIVNYSGHGGEIGWGHERTLEISDINGWRNFDMLPVFITATCEFSRYDDPTRVSAGELVILNPKGGAIAMFTTSRATYASANLTLNMAIYKDNMFLKQDGEYPRFGDVLRRSKLRGDDNDRKFVLLGDPGLHLAYPTLNVETTHINDVEVGTQSDTLRAYDVVKISGIITDENNNLIPDYNGIVYPSVYDKAIDVLTYGDQNPKYQYELRNSVIYKGKVAVVNGKFTFSFMLPKDISYHYGTGRISYYATDFVTDAKGYFEDFVIGGFNDSAETDAQGPVIQLFMNDTTFVNGGTTHETPTILALLSDENGINTTGNGIGHDIIAIITGATETSFILNDFYEADLGESTSGKVRYLTPMLNPGQHILTLKAWDLFNNSSETSISFVVTGSNQMLVDNLYNYPNPFTNETSIVFDHNQAGNELQVELSIFNLQGQRIRTIETDFTGDNFRSEPIRWNGLTDGGDDVPEGLYIYRVFVTNEKGESSEKRAKLLFVK